MAVKSALLLAFLLPTLAFSMVVRHDRDDQEHRNLGQRFADIHVEMNVPGPAGRPGPEGNGLGTLIAPPWVLTAAHVVESITPGRPRYRSNGEHYVTIHDQHHAVASVINHPDYLKWPNRASNIALV